MLPVDGVYGVATHAVDGDTGYGLLRLIVPTGYLKMPYNEKAACTLGGQRAGCFSFGNVGSAFMPTQVQAALGLERVRAYRTHPTRWF